MRQFICAGGGNAEQSKAVDEFFLALLSRKKFLYLPQAIAPERWSFEKTYQWIRNHQVYSDCEIVMWKDIDNKKLKDFENFDAIFLMGGNTFNLMAKLRKTYLFELLPKFLDTGRPILGFSAGAILMGKSIAVAEIGPPGQADENRVGITIFDGLDLLNGYTTYTYYQNGEDQQLFTHAEKYRAQIIGIPEESAIYVAGNLLKVIGTKAVTIIRGTEKLSLELNTDYALS